jgi:hypothetical protein
MKAQRRRSSNSSKLIIDETTSSSVQPAKTRSLESTKRKRQTFEQVSDVELQAASSLAQMTRKKAKKPVKKIVAAEVPSTFDDDLFVEPSQEGFFFWPFLRFNFHEHYPPGSENEFVDIGSFSDIASEVQKEVVTIAAAATVAAEVVGARPSTEASPEFAKNLELTIHRGDDPLQNIPLIETSVNVPEGQDPSLSIAAFNKSFGTSYRGELLSVGYEVAGVGGDASEILTLWKLPILINEIGEGASEQTLHLFGETTRDFGKGLCTPSKKTSISLGKPSTSSGRKLATKDKKGSLLCTALFASYFSILYLWLCFAIFQNLKIFFDRIPRPSSQNTAGIMRQRPLYL